MHTVKEAPTADKDSQEKPRPPKGRREKRGGAWPSGRHYHQHQQQQPTLGQR